MTDFRRPPDLGGFDLSGKIALVTGGARGIGLQIALSLQKAGAEIILADYDEAQAEKAAEKFAVRPEVRRLDVTNSQAANELAGSFPACPDILVNNAGVSRAAPTRETTDDDWRSILAVNLDGVYFCCRAFGCQMAERGSGSIVNIGSMCGLIVTRQESVVTAYNASKAGVHMITKTLACE